MSPTGKAGKPRSKPPKLQGETQFQRFVETVQALGVDDSGKSFEKAFEVIVPVQQAVVQRKTVLLNKGTIKNKAEPNK
jgi:hypothetical protein